MELTTEQKFIYGLLDDFRAYVIDCMGEGMHEGFLSHHSFILESLVNWQEQVIEQSAYPKPFGRTGSSLEALLSSVAGGKVTR